MMREIRQHCGSKVIVDGHHDRGIVLMVSERSMEEETDACISLDLPEVIRLIRHLSAAIEEDADKGLQLILAEGL